MVGQEHVLKALGNALDHDRLHHAYLFTGTRGVGKTTIADETFSPRRCLWAHPPGRGELSIRFRDVPLGEQLVGHGGMYWIVERERAGAPVQLSVRIDGDEVGRVFHADGDGWARFSLPLGAHAGKSRALVEWRISSPDHRHRHYCFEARSL